MTTIASFSLFISEPKFLTYQMKAKRAKALNSDSCNLNKSSAIYFLFEFDQVPLITQDCIFSSLILKYYLNHWYLMTFLRTEQDKAYKGLCMELEFSKYFF